MAHKKSPASAAPPALHRCNHCAAREERIRELEEQLEGKSRRLAFAEHCLQVARTRWEKDTTALRAKAAEHARKVELVASRFAAVEGSAAETRVKRKAGIVSRIKSKTAIVSELCEGMTLPTYRQCVEDARSWGLLESARPPPVKRKATAQLTDRERERLIIRFPKMAEALRKKY